jgi:hypothetical protein
MATEIKCYHIVWEKIIWEDFKYEDFKKKDDKGIYQLYGTHQVYGLNSLLYIGKTDKQTFGERIEQHLDDSDFIYNHFPEYSFFCLGRLQKTEDVSLKKYSEIIGSIEKLLINAHCPAFNSKDVKGLYKNDKKGKVNDFIIINWENYGQLLPEVSTLKFSDKYWKVEDTKNVYE